MHKGGPYNFLNLPRRIEKPTDGIIKVIYTADGQKLWQQTQLYDLSPTNSSSIYYDGEISYENGERIVYTTEGRVTTKANGDLQYQYVLRDHLGNTRVTFADGNADGQIDPQREILQEAHYYPFGLQHYGPYMPTRGDDYNYTYNGKEAVKDLGLNWSDYGARWYDAAVGRWWSVDPLAESYMGWSGYNYVMNIPTIAIDPDGTTVIVRIQGEDGQNIDLIYKNNKLYNGDNEYDVSQNQFASDALQSLNDMVSNSQSASNANDVLTNSTNQFIISYGEEASHSAPDMAGMAEGKGTAYITWNNKEGADLSVVGGYKTDPTMDLGHELYGHGLDANDGKMDYGTVEKTLLPKTEEVASYMENKIRKDMGKPLRTHYNVQLPDSPSLDDDFSKYRIKILNSSNTARKYGNQEIYKKTKKQ